MGGSGESKVQVHGEAQLCWGQVGKVMEKPEDEPGRGGAQETQRQGQKRTGRRREGESGVELTETEHSGGGVLLLVRWTSTSEVQRYLASHAAHPFSVYSPQNLRGDCRQLEL